MVVAAAAWYVTDKMLLAVVVLKLVKVGITFWVVCAAIPVVP